MITPDLSTPRRAVTAPTVTTPIGVAPIDVTRTRRQISHDINHELATIRLLTTLLVDAPDLNAESRHRAALILGETRWLEQLHRAYEDAADAETPLAREHCPPTRMDDVVTEVVDAMRPASPAKIRISTSPVNGRVNRLALWRVLRNVIDNAIRAAGSDGTVDVRIAGSDGWAVIQVDDDGPGFGNGDSGRGRLGLNIVQDFVSSVGGHWEIQRGNLGGCCVRVEVPLVAAPDGVWTERAEPA